jgi:hypothetical protein
MGGLALAILVFSCGDGKKSPTGAGNGDTLPLQDGLYRMVTMATLLTGGAPCEPFVQALNSVDTIRVEDGDLDDDLDDCEFDVDGNEFTISCVTTEPVAGTCVIRIEFEGGGTTTSTSLTATLTVTITGQGDCSQFGIPTCTYQMTITAERISAAPGIPVSSSMRESFLPATRALARGAVRATGG